MAADTVTPHARRARKVHDLARQLGFALVGIAPASPTPRAEYLRQWLAAGQHGDMDYLLKRLDELLDPTKLVPGARSVICVADPYAEQSDSAFRDSRSASPATTNLTTRNASPVGRVARYAWGPDYHRAMKRRLHRMADALRLLWPEHEYRSCVDTAPLLEREYAALAGLGWIGKHTLLIHPRQGSWLLLGEIVTTLAIQTAAETGAQTAIDHCGDCRRCIEACPTQCIDPAGYRLDARRCISYLTIEHRGAIAPSLHPMMGDWIAGCDVCQEVCPFNGSGHGTGDRSQASGVRGQEAGDRGQGSGTPGPSGPDRTSENVPDLALAAPLRAMLDWDAADRERALLGSPLKRIKLDMLKRNVLIAADNALWQRDDPALRKRIEESADDATEPALVQHTARQVLARRAGRRPGPA